MNIQSVNGVSSAPIQPPTATKPDFQSGYSPSQDEMARLVRTGKEMQKAEMSGVKLSVGDEQLIKAIDRAIKALEGPSTMFEMKIHEATKTIVVKVINKDTGELIREVPPEKTLDLVAKMMEFAGILIDERV